MGSKNKLKRFRENETFSNVIQPERSLLEVDGFDLKGQWHSKHFKNDLPIILELGCGKGEYTLHLANENPKMNFIGIDIKGARFWRGAKTALEQNLTNIAFVRAQIELIDTLFCRRGSFRNLDHLSRSPAQIQKDQTPPDPSPFPSKIQTHFTSQRSGSSQNRQ
jgi:tRNA G46 methylase TrmB